MEKRSRHLSRILAVMLAGCMAVGCKKDKVIPEDPSGSSGARHSLAQEDSLKYLMYQIMMESYVEGGRDTLFHLPTYYWYAQVPALDPLSTAFPTAEDLLAEIKTFPVHAGAAVDRYSFLDRTGSVSGEVLNGVVEEAKPGLTGGFGWEVTYASDAAGKSHLTVLYADRNSPAGKAGIERGWEILSVNGDGNIAYDGEGGPHVQKVNNALFHADKVTVTVRKPDNSTASYTLNTAPYRINPLLFDSIYTINGSKVGYFALYTFSGVYNDKGDATLTKEVLDGEFHKLTAAGISDLIVDLRYNGGGAVITAEYLDSAIAPASVKGKVMYRYHYNDKLTENAGVTGLPALVRFPGGGGLQLDHVFFITGARTASASELTLNNLRPYMDVKLVGDTTYGKPVGFINFTISCYDPAGREQHLADLYAIDFETSNALGQGGYYNGIAPDEKAADYINIPWGDGRDDNLRRIFRYVSTGSFAGGASRGRMSAPEKVRLPIRGSVPSHGFHGMIDYELSRQFNSRLRFR